MKVLLVSGSVPPQPCGVGDYTSALATSLQRRGIEVAIATSKGISPQCSVKIFADVETWQASALKTLKVIAKTWNAAVVHLQYPTQGFGYTWAPHFIPLSMSRTGYKVVCTWHEIPNLRSMPRYFLQAVASGPIIAVRPNFHSQLPASLRAFIRAERIAFIRSASSLPIADWRSDERLKFREKFVTPGERLVVYFGFLHEAKGVEQLFSICDPRKDKLVICGNFSDSDPYHLRLKSLADTPAWQGRVQFTGFLGDLDAAKLMSVADAVVLPFRDGGGEWNTSIQAARKQGTFVLTTSSECFGYASQENVYYAKAGAIPEMAEALNAHIGTRARTGDDSDWERIADEHIAIYRRLIEGKY